MPIRYKKNIVAALKEKGYTSYRIRKERLMGEATLQKLRNSELVSWENIATICELLECQPGHILEYVRY
jgi:putative transcriptional regulator